MDFQITPEESQLADSIARLVERSYSFEARRESIASAAGYSDSVWQTMAEMGLLGLPFSEDDGGFAVGAIGMMSVMEAFGKALLVEPYIATVALAGRLVAKLGNDSQRERILPGVIEGKIKLAFAHTEADSRYSLALVTTTATKDGKGWRLDGAKVVVTHAPMADWLVISARTSGKASDAQGISLFLVPADAPGLSCQSYRGVDGTRGADLAISALTVGPEALLGKEGSALPGIEEAVDFATLLQCSEAVGAMASANADTLEYLKTRQQFGVPIGSFQALQHRMVEMTIHAEQARSITSLACARFDEATNGTLSAAERMHYVSAAKVKIAQACRAVGQESIQLHGGMGMSDELKVSHTFKRLTMIAQVCGDLDHHLERFAATAD